MFTKQQQMKCFHAVEFIVKEPFPEIYSKDISFRVHQRNNY